MPPKTTGAASPSTLVFKMSKMFRAKHVREHAGSYSLPSGKDALNQANAAIGQGKPRPLNTLIFMNKIQVRSFMTEKHILKDTIVTNRPGAQYTDYLYLCARTYPIQTGSAYGFRFMPTAKFLFYARDFPGDTALRVVHFEAVTDVAGVRLYVKDAGTRANLETEDITIPEVSVPKPNLPPGYMIDPMTGLVVPNHAASQGLTIPGVNAPLATTFGPSGMFRSKL